MQPTGIAAPPRPLLATLCFSSLGCGELDLEDMLELAVRRRIPSLELRTLNGRNDLPDYFNRRYGTPERLRDAASTWPVRIVSLDSSCNAIASTPAGRAELRALSPWAKALGTPAIRIFDGGERGDGAELESIGPLFDWWRQQGPAPELIVETHDALSRPAALQQFLGLYPGIGILWDTYHTWNEGQESPAVTWSRLRRRTRHLHVKDSVAGQGYVAPGRGEYPFGELIAALRETGFGGVISLEWERHWYPELAPIETALDGFEHIFTAPDFR